MKQNKPNSQVMKLMKVAPVFVILTTYYLMYKMLTDILYFFVNDQTNFDYKFIIKELAIEMKL